MEFATLESTFEELERTSTRLALVEQLTRLIRSIAGADEDEQVCYLVQGRVAPFFVALVMGMAEKAVARSIAQAYHAPPEHITALYNTLGDLGLVAERVNSEAGVVPARLSVADVFEGLQAIARTTGTGAVEKRVARLAGMLTRVDSLSAKYVVRVLLGNLRLGVGDATMLDALAIKFRSEQKIASRAVLPAEHGIDSRCHRTANRGVFKARHREW
jgi:DNA ligase 1